MISGISIIICCFNSASRIEETLRHVFSLSVPENLSCEILLVNNRSTDNTKEVASNTYEIAGIFGYHSKSLTSLSLDCPLHVLEELRNQKMTLLSFVMMITTLRVITWFRLH